MLAFHTSQMDKPVFFEQCNEERTVWTLIRRRVKRAPSDLGPHCSQKLIHSGMAEKWLMHSEKDTNFTLPYPTGYRLILKGLLYTNNKVLRTRQLYCLFKCLVI